MVVIRMVEFACVACIRVLKVEANQPLCLSKCRGSYGGSERQQCVNTMSLIVQYLRSMGKISKSTPTSRVAATSM